MIFKIAGGVFLVLLGLSMVASIPQVVVWINGVIGIIAGLALLFSK